MDAEVSWGGNSVSGELPGLVPGSGSGAQYGPLMAERRCHTAHQYVKGTAPFLRLKRPLTMRGRTMFVLNVSGIGCGSCVSKITKAVQSLDSAAAVSVDRAAGKVSVESIESPERVRAAVEALGFPSTVST